MNIPKTYWKKHQKQTSKHLQLSPRMTHKTLNKNNKKYINAQSNKHRTNHKSTLSAAKSLWWFVARDWFELTPPGEDPRQTFGDWNEIYAKVIPRWRWQGNQREVSRRRRQTSLDPYAYYHGGRLLTKPMKPDLSLTVLHTNRYCIELAQKEKKTQESG